MRTQGGIALSVGLVAALCAASAYGARPVTSEALEILKHSLIHRGDGKGRPDNTMEAMLYTWGKGYAPECDIRYTRDKKEKAR